MKNNNTTSLKKGDTIYRMSKREATIREVIIDKIRTKHWISGESEIVITVFYPNHPNNKFELWRSSSIEDFIDKGCYFGPEDNSYSLFFETREGAEEALFNYIQNWITDTFETFKERDTFLKEMLKKNGLLPSIKALIDQYNSCIDSLTINKVVALSVKDGYVINNNITTAK